MAALPFDCAPDKNPLKSLKACKWLFNHLMLQIEPGKFYLLKEIYQEITLSNQK